MMNHELDAPHFGTDEVDTAEDTSMGQLGLGTFVAGGDELGFALGRGKAEEDELVFSATSDKVQEMTEQLAEFLINFGDLEQMEILSPFLSGDVASVENDPSVEPVMQEARRFVFNYLSNYSQCERDLILEKWRPAMDTASVSGTTESLTPSVTPPGSVTPTAVTPREFLKMRRETNEIYHQSPAGHADM
mmetsp:Transcript_107685/g.347545  ORF Transcript_107685/g.347545 Transcript_107685/m.347545 type:complete len:190 (+) Transcript_107685:168-737(+)